MTVIIVNTPIMQDKIQRIVESMTSIECQFIKKEGIKLYFQTNCLDADRACALIKAEIKKDPIASAITFTVKTHEYDKEK